MFGTALLVVPGSSMQHSVDDCVRITGRGKLMWEFLGGDGVCCVGVGKDQARSWGIHAEK